MEQLNNIELDFLFRIDFNALIYAVDEVDDDTFKLKTEEYKSKYSFANYYFKGDEYIRLKDIQSDLTPYLKYLEDLVKYNRFDCCPLGQAIGLFDNSQPKVLFYTDSGACYNSVYHFEAIEEIFKTGESNEMAVNTFYGEQRGEKLFLEYSHTNSNIHRNDIRNTSYEVDKDIFKSKLEGLKIRIRPVFKEIKNFLEVKQLITDKSDMNEVFNEDL